jgi:ubiquinone/menaquinone biosynthesis C-methylase UbiE
MEWKDFMEWDIIQVALIIIVGWFVAHYVYRRYTSPAILSLEVDEAEREGFANPDDEGGTGKDVVVLSNNHLFDAFYAKVYDKVVDGQVREQTEVAMTLGWAKTFRPEASMLQVLDVGSGTGGIVDKMRKEGVAKVVGMDSSDAMVAHSRKTYPKSDYRVGDVEQIGLFAAGEFNLVTMFYFTIYYLRDRSAAFKNLYQWLQPGGCLVIHGVNREKFDPILEAASPFVAFSVQKYSKERVTKSQVIFDKFTYSADFEHEGGNAEFREEFKFKDGKVRRQVHTMRMPTMEELVAEAEQSGFIFKQFLDLTGIGYEYQYLFCFVR